MARSTERQSGCTVQRQRVRDCFETWECVGCWADWTDTDTLLPDQTHPFRALPCPQDDHCARLTPPTLALALQAVAFCAVDTSTHRLCRKSAKKKTDKKKKKAQNAVAAVCSGSSCRRNARCTWVQGPMADLDSGASQNRYSVGATQSR